jgi:hypothetical protein
MSSFDIWSAECPFRAIERTYTPLRTILMLDAKRAVWIGRSGAQRLPFRFCTERGCTKLCGD